VGVHDVLPQVLWTQYFLQEQGFSIRENIVFQDNQSAILLKTNGTQSTTKKTEEDNILSHNPNNDTSGVVSEIYKI
jgi:hypothetical protein